MYLYNKKLKLIIVFAALLLISTGGIYFLYHENKPSDLNVILITMCSLRADHLGCYGYKRDTSPNIDMIAKEGVLFNHAISQASHSPPSVASILTSTLPRTHLILSWGYTLNPKLSIISEILKAKNYKTMFIGTKVMQTALHGLIKDFDTCILDAGPEKATDKVIKFSEEAAHKPFFIWIHYMSLHFPYRPSPRYEKLFINDTLYNPRRDLPVVKSVFGDYGIGGIPESLAKEKKGITNADYYIAQYDGAIRTVDEEIGRIADYLKSHKLYNKTIFIITSDHGEMFGEHNYYFCHGGFLFEPLIKVPLIIKCDKVIPQNKIIDTPISANLDIMPTLLDIFNMRKDKNMEGVSLLGIISGKEKYHPDVISDDGVGAESIRSGEWKLIRNKVDNIYYLYNLKEDPGELNSLVSVEKNKFKLLKQKLDKYGCVNPHNKINKFIPDENTEESLKSLGYAN